MKKIIIAVAAVVVLVLGAGFLIPLFISTETVKAELVQRLEQATGRKARIDGTVKVRVLPFTRLSAEGVGLSGVTDNRDSFSVESVSFGVNLFALLGGKVEISGVTLVKPRIVFDQSGTAAANAAPSGGAAESGTEVAGAINRLRLGTVSISEGEVVWRGRGGAEETFSRVNVTAHVPTLAEGGTVKGDLVWRKNKFDVELTLAATAAGSTISRLPLQFRVTTDAARLMGAGEILSEGSLFSGNFTFEGPSLAGAIAIIGGSVPDAPAFGTFSVKGKLKASEAQLTLEEFALSLEGVAARGAAQVAFDRARPGIGLRLAADFVDLNSFVAPASAANAGTGGTAARTALPDLSAAKLADANIELTAAALVAGTARLEGVSATATLVDGVLKATARSSAISGVAQAAGLALDGVTVETDLTNLDKAGKIGGVATWRGERFQIEATASPSSLLGGRSARIQAKAISRRVTAGYAGTIAGATTGSGDVSLSTPSLRGLLAWLDQPIGDGAGLQAFSFEGPVRLEDGKVSFENARFGLDGSAGRANGSVAYGGAKPSIQAGVALTKLDLTPYVSGSGSGKSGGSGGGASSGWSTASLGLDDLKALDASLNLTADQIVIDSINTGRTRLTVKLAGGTLDAELGEMSLYNGAGTGRLKIEGAKATPAVAFAFNLAGLSARAFLADAMGLSRVDGTGNFRIELASSGASTMALMQSLSGKASFEVRDGAIIGVNISQMMKNLTQSILEGFQQTANQQTDFTRFTASFAVDKGIATTSDLLLVGPVVRVTGAGSVNIPSQTVSFRVDPKIVAANQNLSGFEVPIVIEGPWSRPRIYPQIEGILQNPGKAFDQLKGLFGGSGDGQSSGPADILKGFVQPQANQPQPNQPQPNQQVNQPQPKQPQPNQPQPNQQVDQSQPNQPPKPEDLLKKLLGNN